VCDHPSYCRNDKRSIYLGQSHHLAYGGHWHNNHLPRGLMVWKNRFRQNGMCYFTGNHGGKHRDLCAVGNSHQWRTAIQNRYYMCAKVTGRWNAHGVSRVWRTWHNIRLAAKNGVPARRYTFREMRYQGHHGGDYSQTAIKGCRQNGHGWKPVCDHPSYCRNDRKSIYIGQSHHMAYGGHWNNSYMPRGLYVHKNQFRRDGMCYYTGRHGGNHRNLCAHGNSHTWRTATQNRYYMCARILGGWAPRSRVYSLVRANVECRSRDRWLGRYGNVAQCAAACKRTSGCQTFVFGIRNKHGKCYQEYTDARCRNGWERDNYNFYKMNQVASRYSGRGWCETFHSCKRGDGRNFWAWVKGQGYRMYKGACAHSNGRYGRRHRYWPGHFTYGQCKAKCDRMGGSCQGITMPANIRRVRL